MIKVKRFRTTPPYRNGQKRGRKCWKSLRNLKSKEAVLKYGRSGTYNAPCAPPNFSRRKFWRTFRTTSDTTSIKCRRIIASCNWTSSVLGNNSEIHLIVSTSSQLAVQISFCRWSKILSFIAYVIATRSSKTTSCLLQTPVTISEVSVVIEVCSRGTSESLLLVICEELDHHVRSR